MPDTSIDRVPETPSTLTVADARTLATPSSVTCWNENAPMRSPQTSAVAGNDADYVSFVQSQFRDDRVHFSLSRFSEDLDEIGCSILCASNPRGGNFKRE